MGPLACYAASGVRLFHICGVLGHPYRYLEPNVELRGLARLFAGFILWCGLTHLMSIIVLWHPVYELQGLVKGATAIISVSTAILIFPLIPRALAIPSPNELQIANAELKREVAAHKQTLAALESARAELEQRVADCTEEVRAATLPNAICAPV